MDRQTDSWQFWIDVGGTFTDCFAATPSGSLLRHKVLSSGVVKGRISPERSDTRWLVDLNRSGDPSDIWRGYQIRLLNVNGTEVGESQVVVFDSEKGRFELADQLPTDALSYELTSGEEAPILAIRYLMKLGLDEPIPPLTLKLGTTRGTNALLTRSGAKTAFVTTRGFADILRIGYQNRPKLFDLNIRKPEPLFVVTAEIDERVAVDGEILTPLQREQVRACLQSLREQGVESLAICLMNAYQHPAHEQTVGRIAREVGFDEVSLSHEVAPLIKIVSRGDTTTVDAYLNPVLKSYVASLQESLVGRALLPVDTEETSNDSHSCERSNVASEVRLLTSAGGLVSAERFSGKDSILSGPAGGVVGFARVAQAAGFDRAIGFDMGGTSTDVSRFDGRFELEYEVEKAGTRIVAPMMAIETVAAGGGSICHFDGVQLAVGPDSAGADPGPACYGRGGPLTVTDVNFYLGKLLPQYFPFPLNVEAVERRLIEAIDEIQKATDKSYDTAELVDGFLQIANANMAAAIRSISIAKGYDPRDYVLVAFGGAAPQHACAVAEQLGIRKILNHPDSGILSAYGIGLADVTRHRTAGVYRKYTQEAIDELEPIFQRLIDEARREVLAEGTGGQQVSNEQIEVTRSLDIRYLGMDAFLTIPESDKTYAESFLEHHRRQYGYVHEHRDLEIVAAKVEVVGHSNNQLPTSDRVERKRPAATAKTSIYFAGEKREANVFHRRRLTPGDAIDGPAIILEQVSTTVVDPGWTAEVLTNGELLFEQTEANELLAERREPSGNTCGSQEPRANTELREHVKPDPVLLEIFNNQFAAIAEQMGITLRNTSSSVNVKERLDFSCAVFTATGDLVVNAPHIPVHLGAMSETVKRTIADNPAIHPGDVFVTNDPYRGGSHLPDVTVITPVHDDVSELLFFTASRAHHAEIGGITPGSMPPFSTNLSQEGVLIRNFKLVDAGKSREDALRELLISGEYPSRSPEDNLVDIAAQVAANRQGADDLNDVVRRYSAAVTLDYMRHIQDAAEQKMRAALRSLPDGRREFVDYLDDGSPIAAAITISGDTIEIDFTGTGPVMSGNLNANRAIVTAAVMYCLRCLIGYETSSGSKSEQSSTRMPLNQGVLAPVTIILPECLLNPPTHEAAEDCAAIVGGNVETSQRVVDVLFGALGIAAASQGTSNNVLFGDESFGYYETICGGSGATEFGPGADAVHVHMTNTRLTDSEVLEQRFPARIREFSIRQGSGGTGHHTGGNGIIRKIEFLKPLDVSLLTQRRADYQPYGAAGGQPGSLGKNTLVKANGETEDLPSLAKREVAPGDTLVIETSGGGGWGQAEP